MKIFQRFSLDYPTDYALALDVIARGCGLDPALVRAIVQVESAGDPRAIRYDQGFFERHVRGSHYPPETHRMLSSGLGLMQVMGLAAREMGFLRPLEVLCVPEVGLLYGCLRLSTFWRWYGGNVEEAVAAYRGGSVQMGPNGFLVNSGGYVNRVLAALKALT